MKVYLKPIQMNEIKGDISAEFDENTTLIDLFQRYSLSSIKLMFRGKKLDVNKTLVEQGIKDGTKLMMYKSEKEEIPIINNSKSESAEILIKEGFEKELV